ncbi:hypothetical protein IE53DRAFT_388836 [Violaceomyces palustris]|uniref:Uncharacterized protein n=1 Tax=Violaceomyces palustris TaxID=1673888 RepID=A0ACD0NT78_9BASI|nr:hypothetical protein IE53DRAFT_388836 [Violaceomyces palustris]
MATADVQHPRPQRGTMIPFPPSRGPPSPTTRPCRIGVAKPTDRSYPYPTTGSHPDASQETTTPPPTTCSSLRSTPGPSSSTARGSTITPSTDTPPSRSTPTSFPPVLKPFPCPHPGCGKSYSKKSKLAQHARSHTGERPFRCHHPGCQACYMRSDHLKVHLRSHLDQSHKSFRCEQCTSSFWTRSHLTNHVRQCHSLPDVLPLASIQSVEPDGDLELPVAQGPPSQPLVAANTGSFRYACQEEGCQLAFRQRKHLRQHVRQSHSDLYLRQQWQELQRKRQPSSSLRQDEPSGSVVALRDSEGNELSSQEVERRLLLPYACQHPGCERRFATNSKRKSHSKRHEEGRYTCALPHPKGRNAEEEGEEEDQGVMTFPTWTSLQSHMKQFHPPTCPWPGCGKTFGRADNLKTHLRRHREKEEEEEEEEEEKRPFQQRGSSKGSSARGGEGAAIELSDSDESETDQDESEEDESDAERPTDAEVKGSTIPRARKAFRCTWNHCDKSYTRRFALQVHIRTAHVGEKPHECRTCSRRFAHKHLLVRHRRQCRSVGKVEQGEDEEEEMSDEYFRKEGGAVPEKDSSRPRAAKRRSAEEGEEEMDEEKVRRRRMGLLKLLTGEEYSEGGGGGGEESCGEGKSPKRKRRKIRGRVVSCPWDRIVELGRGKGGEEEAEVGGGEGSRGEVVNNDDNLKCPYRFSRLYDLRRHMSALHGIQLDDLELEDLVPREELDRLAKRRRKD